MTTLTVVVPAAHDKRAAILRMLAYATAALAPVEGYLTAAHPHLGKVAPALLIATWLVVRLRQRSLPSPTPLHAVLALLAVVVAATAAMHSPGAFTAEYLVRWLPFLVLTVVLADVACREVPIRGLLLAMAAGATVAGVGALYSLIFEGQARASGPQADPNDLAYFLVAAIPLLFVAGRGSRWRLAVVVLAGAVLVAGAMATFSRGGVLGLAAATGWLTLRRVLPWRALAVGVVAVATLLMGASLFAGPRLERAVEEKTFIAASNVDTRELRWQAAVRMVAEHPVSGVGPGGFREAYAAESHNAEIDEQTPVAHNMYLEVAAELGLPGFALFGTVIGIAGVVSERAIRLAAWSSSFRIEVVAIQASLLAVLVMSTFLSEQYYLPLWSLAALAVAAEIRALRKARGEEQYRCVSCT
ncbi:O-antigen ligase family protein [Amycolatopsis regifaucium]|uniref:Polymerase n=1 Tax=Amycolatopsis regifaucium TaxID=546365 RepID=A0A154M9I2_9PSEU|nr:O-antigen ligase family protein [Amycolatopsis regifaucium]KZB81053.1 polymerase [Amycolatopsis regifaucium]OKA04778.1 polymerase [Amycolatopsis regifaucium]SFJ71445.1 O-antigen ligase [Amycolatopsis regifaucium]